MAAGEDQPQLVVAHDGVGQRRRLAASNRSGAHGRGLLARPLRLTAQPVERPVAGDDRQPGARVVGDAVARPALQRRDGGVLHRVLGEVEAAERPGEGGEDPPPSTRIISASGSCGRLSPGPSSSTGRTSTEPGQAPGICAAQLDRLVEVGALEQVEAAEDLLGLGEGAVAGDDVAALAALHPHGRGRAGGLQGVAAR